MSEVMSLWHRIRFGPKIEIRILSISYMVPPSRGQLPSRQEGTPVSSSARDIECRKGRKPSKQGQFPTLSLLPTPYNTNTSLQDDYFYYYWLSTVQDAQTDSERMRELQSDTGEVLPGSEETFHTRNPPSTKIDVGLSELDFTAHLKRAAAGDIWGVGGRGATTELLLPYDAAFGELGAGEIAIPDKFGGGTADEEQRRRWLLRNLVLGKDERVPWQTRWLGVAMDAKGLKRKSDLSQLESDYSRWIDTPYLNFFGVREFSGYVRNQNATQRIRLLQKRLEVLGRAYERWGMLEWDGVVGGDEKAVTSEKKRAEKTSSGAGVSSGALSPPRAAKGESTVKILSDGDQTQNAFNEVTASGKTTASPPFSAARSSRRSSTEEELNINSLQMLMDRNQFFRDGERPADIIRRTKGGCLNRFYRPVCCDEVEPEVEGTAGCLNGDFEITAETAIVTGVFGPGNKDEFTKGAIKMGRSINAVLGQENPNNGTTNDRRRADLVILEINQFPIADRYRNALLNAGWKICTVSCIRNRHVIHQPALRHRFTFTKIKVLSLVDYRRVIWLDSDVQIVGKIDELVDFDFRADGRDCKMAAVRDLMIDSQNSKQPGIENRHNFNAGLMIMEPSWQDYFRLMQLLGPQHGKFHPAAHKMWWDRSRRERMAEWVEGRGKIIFTSSMPGDDEEAEQEWQHEKKSAGDEGAGVREPGGSLLAEERVDSTAGTSGSNTTTVLLRADVVPSDHEELYFGRIFPDEVVGEYLASAINSTDEEDEPVVSTDDPPNTLAQPPIHTTIFNPSTKEREPIHIAAAVFITHPTIVESGIIEHDEAIRYLPDPTFSEQGFWNDNYRHDWCRLPCKYNAILPYALVPRLRWIWERCNRDVRIVHWALFKPHHCPKLEGRWVGFEPQPPNGVAAGAEGVGEEVVVDGAGEDGDPVAGGPKRGSSVEESDRGTSDHPTAAGDSSASLGSSSGGVVAEDLLSFANVTEDVPPLAKSVEGDQRVRPPLPTAKSVEGASFDHGRFLSNFVKPTPENEHFFFREKWESVDGGRREGVVMPFHPSAVEIRNSSLSGTTVHRVGYYDYDPAFILRGYLWNLGNSGLEARLMVRLFCFFYHIV